MKPTNMTAMHHECVACLSLDETGEVAALGLLRMIVIEELEPREVLRDLCFIHRRVLNENGYVEPEEPEAS